VLVEERARVEQHAKGLPKRAFAFCHSHAVVEDEQTGEDACWLRDAPRMPDPRRRTKCIVETLPDANERSEKRPQSRRLHAQGMPEWVDGSAQSIDCGGVEPIASFGAGHVSNMARAKNSL
jgi:hypothetical protein